TRMASAIFPHPASQDGRAERRDKTMAEQDKELQTVHAPYNFIEFPRQILEDRADNVDHSCLDASRRTGEIKITLTAETPVFVSDGNKDDPHFFRAPGGNYALPGS